MFNFLKRHRYRISIGLILAVFFLILVGQVEKGRVDNWFTATLQTLAYPFQATTDWVVDGTTGLWRRYLWLVAVEEENRLLKRELQAYQEESAKNRELVLAYDRLLNMLSFQKTNPDEKIFAEVVGEQRDSFSKLLVINRGSRDGVRKNFAVVTPQGVVGKIKSVTPFQSVVQLITDSRSHFPALLQQTRMKAMVQGELDGSLRISNFPRRFQLNRGDLIVTSGLAGIFPKGLPIGRVWEVEKKNFGLFQKVKLAPAVALDQLEEVAVILYSVRNIHQPLFTEEE